MSFITFGEIMLRLTPSDHSAKIASANSYKAHYAGSESNVACSLAILGNDVQFVSKLPENQLGDGAIQSLRSFGISTKHILRGGNRIGTYYIEIGASIRPSSVIYDRKASAISQIKPGEFDWDTILRNQKWLFISGITPALSDTCAEETIRLVKTAKRLNIKVAFDMNFRRTLWSDVKNARKIFDEILDSTDLLFGNTGVLEDVYDLPIEGENPVDKTLYAVERAREKFGINLLAFTIRDHVSASQNRLSGVVLGNENPILSNSYNVEIQDRFGTGDSFAAAFLHALNQGWNHEKSIGFATAAFALKHTILGDQNTSSEKEISAIYEGKTSGHVLR